MVSKQRSYNMSRIKSKDTSIELKVRKYLYHKGYRYQKNVKTLPGTPDIYISKYNVAIFINGCFWHGHEVDSHLPHSNRDFWQKKIMRNKQRDERDRQALKRMGWKVMTIWECQLNTDKLKREFGTLVNLFQIIHDLNLNLRIWTKD